jgi:hypothetical protein
MLGFGLGIPFLAILDSLIVAACCKSMCLLVGIGAPETDFWNAKSEL